MSDIVQLKENGVLKYLKTHAKAVENLDTTIQTAIKNALLNRGTKLWSGAFWLSADQTITPTKPLSQCENGWVIVTEVYRDSGAGGGDVDYHFIPKAPIATHTGQNHKLMTFTAAGTPVYKQIYITDTNFKGNASNSTGDNGKIVFSEVWAW